MIGFSIPKSSVSNQVIQVIKMRAKSSFLVSFVSLFLVVISLGCGGGSSDSTSKQGANQSTGGGTNSNTTEDQIAQGNLNLFWTSEMKAKFGHNDVVVEMLEMDDIAINPTRTTRGGVQRGSVKTEHQKHNEKMLAAIEKSYGQAYFEKIKSMAAVEAEHISQARHRRGDWKKNWKKAQIINK